jgi:hypothetical protein
LSLSSTSEFWDMNAIPENQGLVNLMSGRWFSLVTSTSGRARAIARWCGYKFEEMEIVVAQGLIIDYNTSQYHALRCGIVCICLLHTLILHRSFLREW